MEKIERICKNCNCNFLIYESSLKSSNILRARQLEIYSLLKELIWKD